MLWAVGVAPPKSKSKLSYYHQIFTLYTSQRASSNEVPQPYQFCSSFAPSTLAMHPPQSSNAITLSRAGKDQVLWFQLRNFFTGSYSLPNGKLAMLLKEENTEKNYTVSCCEYYLV